MSNATPTQLRFPPFAGLTVRADFEGGALLLMVIRLRPPAAARR